MAYKKKCKYCGKEIEKGMIAYCSSRCAILAKKERAKKKNSVKLGKTDRLTSFQTLKRDYAWPEFSRYIRMKYADKNGNVRCCTCNKKMHWKKSQAGHYVDGRGLLVLFDEMLVHPQCKKCNGKHDGGLCGNKIPYTAFMMKTYNLTIDQCQELDRKRGKSMKMSISELHDMWQKYKKLAKIEEERIKG